MHERQETVKSGRRCGERRRATSRPHRFPPPPPCAAAAAASMHTPCTAPPDTRLLLHDILVADALLVPLRAGGANRSQGQTEALPVRYNGRKSLCHLLPEASRDRRSRVKTQDVARRYYISLGTTKGTSGKDDYPGESGAPSGYSRASGACERRAARGGRGAFGRGLRGHNSPARQPDP